jgi:DNA repair protein RecO (recombination protein O)
MLVPAAWWVPVGQAWVSVDRQAREHLQRSFVLHRRDFGNTSLIVEVFSADYGRLPVLAKGAKHGRSAASALLQPFQPLWLGWTGRGEVHTLIRSEPAGRAFTLQGRALFCGFYLNELLVRLLGRDDPHQDLFAFYHAALTALARGDDLETALRQFELRLLQELGFALVLDREADSDAPVNPDMRYRCEPDSGPRRLVAGEGGFGVSGETLLRLAAGERLTGETAREARGLMRRLLAPHLGERPLKSRELFRRWRGRGASSVDVGE